MKKNNKYARYVNATKAVILARVSSKEQESGKSLDAQIEICEEYANRKNIEVIQTYRIVESSTTGDRTEFNEMLKFCYKQKEPIAIICHTVDRFQRSFKESVDIQPKITEGKIELHFVGSALIINRDNIDFLEAVWDTQVISSKGYASAIKVNTKRGLTKKIEDGELPCLAPMGYLNAQDPYTKKNTVILDEERWQIVKKLFEDYATEEISISGLCERAKEYGLRNRKGAYYAKATIHRTLCSPFYSGYILYRGELHKHNYPLFVDKEIYDICQKKRDDRNLNKKHRIKSLSKKFIFKDILKCGTCGCKISSAEKKGKYVYLSCSHAKGNCEEKEVSEAKVMPEIEKAIDKIVIPSEYIPAIFENLRKYAIQEGNFNVIVNNRADSEIKKIDSKLQRLLELRMNNELSPEEYAEHKNRFIKQKEEFEREKVSNTIPTDEFVLSMETIVKMSQNILKIFKSSKVEEKNKILNILLWNLTLKKKRIDFSYRKPFDLLCKQGSDLKRVDDEI